MYGVASPANRVAGGGKYLTSDTDKVIASLVSRYIKILSPNIHIPLSDSIDGNGHSFSDVYLKYQGGRIVSDIKSSLDKLKNNDEQDSRDPCISPPELSMFHKAQGLAFAVADPTANFTKKVAVNTIVGTYGAGAYVTNGVQNIGLAIGNIFHNTGLAIGNTFNNLSANVVASLPDENNLTTLTPSVSDSAPENPSSLIKTTEATPPSNSNSASDEENNIPSQSSEPASYDTNNVNIENTGGGGGNSGSGGGGGNVEEEVNLPAEPTPEIIIPPVIEPEIIPPAVDSPLVPDIIPPVITLIGDSSVEITKDAVYTDAGATALDDIDKDITANIIIVNPVDTTTLGTYTITYDVSDAQNNIAIQVTRTVSVVAPLPPPPPAPPVLTTTTINQNTTLAPGEYNYDNLIITNNAVLTLEGDPASTNDFKGVKINAVNITIDAGSSISADYKGYGPNQGPGAEEDLSAISNPGASYGGISYANPDGITYGSATRPIDLGSGGTTHGGGAIRIIVSDTFINNGIVSANGDTSSSGGSIYVTAKNTGGSGLFSANGGRLHGSGYFKSPGGGGRVALYYQVSSFSGTAEAKGGCGRYDGATFTCSGDGTVGFFDESANDLYVNNYWRFQKNDSPLNFNNVVLTRAKVEINDEVEINANEIILDKTSTLTLSGGEIINANNLSLLGNSIITIMPEKILSLKVSNLNIENGSMISADDKGYINGLGSPGTNYQAGASYGGKGGGATAKPTYGFDREPVDFGSGTESHRGGGAIRLVVDNNFKNDGIVSASAIQQRVSGGSIYVTTNNISGNGVFQVNGGNSSDPYGPIAGGGGRIAIHYKTSDFSGMTTALAGKYCYSGCNPAGEAGTVKMIDDSIPIPPPVILSSEKIITVFNFSSLTPNIVGTIDETNHTISLTVPFDTDVKVLVPTISISEKASINPNTDIAQDFISPITYTVTAEDGSTQNYVVTVLITPAPEPEPEPIPDTTPPTITSYTFNGVADNITTDPLANPVSIVLTSNEKVNWTSIKIENQDKPNIHKYFYDGNGCVNGTNTCTKIWNGETFGGTLQNGIYKIKVHMKDLANNNFNDYLSPHSIIVNSPI